MRALRLLRGVVLTSLAWGFAWAILSVVATLVSALLSPPDTDLVVASPPFAIMAFYGILGIWAGGVFAVVMAISERRHTFADLSTRRVITWGVLGGISYPILGTLINKIVGGAHIEGFGTALVLTGVFGALSAWAMLVAARRAGSRPPSQLSATRPTEWRDVSTGERSDVRTN